MRPLIHFPSNSNLIINDFLVDMVYYDMLNQICPLSSIECLFCIRYNHVLDL